MRQVFSHRLLMAPLLALMIGCSGTDSAGPAEFIRFTEKPANGLKKEITTTDWVYQFQYKPAEYIALRETSGQVTDTLLFNRRLKQLAGTVWFNVSLRPRKGDIHPLKQQVAGLEDYNRRLNYFLTVAEKNFSLHYGTHGEMPVAGYFFENNYGLTPMDVMIIGFRIPDDHPRQDITLAYTDGLFSDGIMKLKITGRELDNIPQLKF